MDAKESVFAAVWRLLHEEEDRILRVAQYSTDEKPDRAFHQMMEAFYLAHCAKWKAEVREPNGVRNSFEFRAMDRLEAIAYLKHQAPEGVLLYLAQV